MALEGVIDGGGGCASCLAVVGGETGSLLDSAAGNFASGGFDDDVGSWDAAGMKPHIVGGSLMEGDFFVLATVLTNQQGKAVAALDMQGNTSCWRYWFSLQLFATLAFFSCFLGFLLLRFWRAAHVASRLHLGFDEGHFRGSIGQHEIGQQLFYGRQFAGVLLNLRRDEGSGAAQFMIFVEQTVGVAYSVKAGIKRKGDIGLTTFCLIFKIVVESDAAQSLSHLVLMGQE